RLSGRTGRIQGIPPAFLKPLTKKRVFEGEVLIFLAEVFGLPSPNVKWFRNKTQLVADERIKIKRDGDNITLEIKNVTKADQGEYICEAINYVGEAKSVALVMVASQEAKFMPAPPTVTHQHVIQFDVEDNDSSRSPSPQEILLEVDSTCNGYYGGKFYQNCITYLKFTSTLTHSVYLELPDIYLL
uniref:Ig-like domain-containing protein n=1 Tax=Paramormyrops kingsleyae TaxID=1676925 RepID=A0A3B3QBY4_9TELE